MATNVRWKWCLLPILGIALLAGGLVPVEGGKPKPPPPVLYTIQFWTAPDGGPVDQVNKMNNFGLIVGYYGTPEGERRAFLYDPMYDPSGNPTATTAIDLNTIAFVPSGWEDWVIASATGINDNGVIVGYLQPAGTYVGDVRKAYVLDMSAETPTVVLLPEPPDAFAWWMRINNNGDILETYEKPDGTSGAYVYKWGTDHSVTDLGATGSGAVALNNHTQVAIQLYDGSSYRAYRWTPPGTFEPIGGTDTTTTGMNDWGTVCGGTYAKAPKGKVQTYPYRWNGSLQVLFGVPGPAQAINSDSDLFMGGPYTKLYVYQDTKASFFDVDTLIDPSDPDAAIWSSRSGNMAGDMNDRVGTTRFGQLAGRYLLWNDGWYGYLLTPRSP